MIVNSVRVSVFVCPHVHKCMELCVCVCVCVCVCYFELFFILIASGQCVCGAEWKVKCIHD